MSTEPNVAVPDVIVDSREPDEVYLAIRASCKGRVVTQEAISTDIIIPGENGWAIERKTVNDFINTYQANRLEEQLANLKVFQNNGWNVAVMITGSAPGQLKKRKVNPMAYQNMLNSLPAKWGIQVIPVTYEWQTGPTVNYFAGAVKGEKRDYKIAKAAPRDATPGEQARYVLESMPGIGVRVSEKVRKETSSFAHFIYWLTNEGINDLSNSYMKEITSLTELQKKKLRTVINADWKPQNDQETTKD